MDQRPSVARAGQILSVAGNEMLRDLVRYWLEIQCARRSWRDQLVRVQPR